MNNIKIFDSIVLLFSAFILSLSMPVYAIQGDLDGDFRVDMIDLQIFTDQWLDPSGCSGLGCADFDNTDKIDLIDFSILANQWLNYRIPLVINEFMASNNSESGISDPEGDYDDWLEIYNFGYTDIDIGGMYLTDNFANPTKWQIPQSYPGQTTVPAGGFVVFWADEDTEDGPLHADFKLSASGEEIGLFLDADTMIDGIVFGEQATNISYGRYPDADDNLRYFAVTTPGAENDGTYFGLVDKIEISHERGYYDSDFDVLLFCDTNNATIRYTLDGSEPSEMAGTIYTPGVGIPITTTTCLRAVAYKTPDQPSPVITHTYIFVDDVAQQPTDPPGWPSDWGYCSECGDITPSDYEMDPRVVNNTLPGYSIRDALLDLPTVSIAMEPDEFISDEIGLYANPGSLAEYKCSIEYMPLNGEDFQYNCKIENHGGSSRRPYRMQKHNLRLTFTSIYGPAKLKYPLFPESPVDEFNQLLLRASFTDSWGLVSWMPSRYRPNDSQYIRDVWMKKSLGDMGQPTSYGNFVNLYVNGLYFGIHNLTDRLADDFFADHLGGEPEDWEINKDFSTPGSRWNSMMSIGPSTIAGYAQMQEYLDVENLADYMLLHFYADAEDWPHHNGYATVNKNPVSGDGKYRFFVWDQEIVLDYHGRFISRVDSASGVGAIFQKMRTSEEFRLLFADRVQKHCFNDGALSVTNSQNRYLEIANWIDKAIVAESARWGDTQMSTPYGNSIDIPSDPENPDDIYYPMPPHGPDYYFTREDSWVLERDCVINNYIPAIHDTNNSYAIINILRSKNLFPSFDASVFNVNGSYQHGGYVTNSDAITITDPDSAGTIYYTIDGNDPRVPGEASTPEQVVLLSADAAKKVLVPTGDIGTTWRGGSEPYDDSSWTSGTGGVGYERSSGYESWIDIDVESEMYNNYYGCYVRIPFIIDSGVLAELVSLTLKIISDDGFVAYINGIEVERENFTGTPQWNSHADTGIERSGFTNYDITSHINELDAGDNILTIHGMNATLASTDFLVYVEVVGANSVQISEPNISPSAIKYTGGFNLDKSTDLKARIYKSSTAEWSALNEAVYGLEGVAESLRITEIMYHTYDENNTVDPNTEYIELTNIGTTAINLNLVSFTNGIDFTFPDITLNPDKFVLVVQDEDSFTAKYGSGANIAGTFAGRLSNGGERIELADALGETIQDFKYKDGWYPITDGRGFSLTVIDPENSDPNIFDDKDGWRPSVYIYGSPGIDDSAYAHNPGDIVINEVLAHQDSSPGDWIELYNTTTETIDISGWYLSDNDINDANLMKYQIPSSTSIAAGDYLVFTENDHFGAYFALSENGDDVFLTSALDANSHLTGYREQEDFGASQSNVAFGRYLKSTGTYNFVAMSSNTPGAANAYPKVGPVVISEIMYHPDWLTGSTYDNDEFEYVELYNNSGSDITLYDYDEAAPWAFTQGIDYTFSAASPVTIPAGGYILVVENPVAFAERFPSVPSGIIYGPYDGKLANDGEKLQISMPGEEVDGVRYYIRVDRIVYSDGSHPDDFDGSDPWPTEADGQGYSLTRINDNYYGNDPNNWQAATPTPGE